VLDLVAAPALSGNLNFDCRVNADVLSNYLSSAPLVVDIANAGLLG